MEHVYITVHSESGSVTELPDVTEIKIDRWTAMHAQHASHAVLVQCGSQLKSPNSIDDTKVWTYHLAHQKSLMYTTVCSSMLPN